MKKILAILLACSAMIFSLAGCKDDDVLPDGVLDPEIMGEWYSDELKGSLEFTEDGIVYRESDYSETMSFTSGGRFSMSGIEIPYEFDGTQLKVVYSYSDIGIDGEDPNEKIELMTIRRKGDSDKSSLDGEYDLISGELYNSFGLAASTEEEKPEVTFTISGESCFVREEMCEFTANGAVLKMFGKGVSNLGSENSEECKYSISEDTLSLTTKNVTRDFKKVK